MMEGLHEFSQEIRRIAECPYTPSLKVCGYLWIGMLRIEILFVGSSVTLVEDRGSWTRSELIHGSSDFMNSCKTRIPISCVAGLEAIHARLTP